MTPMHHPLLPPLLAVGWEVFLQILPFIIAILVWVINRFAASAAQRPPPRAGMRKPPAPPAKPAGDPLRNEIDEFLRQANAAREGKGASAQAMKPSMPAQQRGGPPEATPPGQSPITRPQRRPQPLPGKRVVRREETRPTPSPVRPPVVVEVVEAPPVRESVAEHVAQTLDSEKFSRRATQLSQVQQASDDEFRKHMQSVFQHGLGNLNPQPPGIFEAAAQAAAATASAAAVKTAAAAGGSQTAAAPSATKKGTTDIALFLAGRKNARDAIILTEILRRPEDRW